MSLPAPSGVLSSVGWLSSYETQQCGDGPKRWVSQGLDTTHDDPFIPALKKQALGIWEC